MDKTKILKTMILRLPKYDPTKQHIVAKRVQNRMSQVPLPLTYKLSDLPPNTRHPAEVVTPLGLKQELPFTVRNNRVYKFLI